VERRDPESPDDFRVTFEVGPRFSDEIVTLNFRGDDAEEQLLRIGQELGVGPIMLRPDHRHRWVFRPQFDEESWRCASLLFPYFIGVVGNANRVQDPRDQAFLGQLASVGTEPVLAPTRIHDAARSRPDLGVAVIRSSPRYIEQIQATGDASDGRQAGRVIYEWVEAAENAAERKKRHAQMHGTQVEALHLAVRFAQADGEISDAERATLVRLAEAFGIPKDLIAMLSVAGQGIH
jgi:tellurite resistance protein